VTALDHLPYGVFSTAERPPRAGVLVDDRVLDLADAAETGLLGADPSLFAAPNLNAFMAAGPAVWRPARRRRIPPIP
jgi:fumarylacetoacetase